jgi:hypothetical protein
MKLARWWLTGILFFLPLQYYLFRKINLWDNDVATFINIVDEITIVVFSLLALIEFYRNKKINYKLYLIVLIPIVVFAIYGFVSGMINGNPLLITILGIFDYIKFFFIIFIYAAFFREEDKLKNICKSLIVMGVIFGIVAVVQELWAVGSVYIGGKSIQDPSIYFLMPAVEIELTGNYWRLGIFRAPSLLGHPIYLGFYSLLILSVYSHMVKKTNLAAVILLIVGIVLSSSRTIYAGFLFMTGMRFKKGGKIFFIVLVPVVIIFFLMMFLSDFHVVKLLEIPLLQNMEIDNTFVPGGISFRSYTLTKALEVWKDHPVAGAGPGMFGSPISAKFNSPLYVEYNFEKNWMFNRTGGIDQFWPYLLAEMGIAGTLLYANVIISLFAFFIILRKQAISRELKELFKGLELFIVVIIIWMFGSGIYNSIIFIYCAIAGLALGCVDKEDYID